MGCPTTGGVMGEAITIDRSEPFVRFLKVLTTKAKVHSGSVLVNPTGEIVGMHFGWIIDGEGFLSAQDIRMTVGELISKGKVDYGWIGTQLEDGKEGVRVTDVLSGSPAERAGLKENDVVLRLNGADVGSSSELIEKIRARSSGDKLKLEVLRKKHPLKLTVVLGPLSKSKKGSTPDYFIPILGDFIRQPSAPQ
jgi:serine protease Do